MKTTMDEAGRVVIPVAIRALAGLRPGTELEVLYEDGWVRIARSVPGPELVRDGKLLVARPRVPAKDLSRIDVAKLIEEQRDRWPR